MVTFQGFLLATGLLGFTAARTNCYYPNGDINNTYVPCNPDAQFSACCASTDECLTNGLCRPAGSQYSQNDFWRDLCTDPLWQSDACPKYCYNDTTAATAALGTYFVTSCSWDTYCCADVDLWSQGDTTACCSDKTALFNGGPAKWEAGPHVSTAVYAISSSSTSSSTSSPTSPSTTTSTPASRTSITPLRTPTDAQNAANTSSSGLSTGDKAGIGVAVAVAVIAIIVAVAALILLRRSRRRKAQEGGATISTWASPPENKSVYAHYDPAPTDNSNYALASANTTTYDAAPTSIAQYYDPPPSVNNAPAQEMEGQSLQELAGQERKTQGATNISEMES